MGKLIVTMAQHIKIVGIRVEELPDAIKRVDDDDDIGIIPAVIITISRVQYRDPR